MTQSIKLNIKRRNDHLHQLTEEYSEQFNQTNQELICSIFAVIHFFFLMRIEHKII